MARKLLHVSTLLLFFLSGQTCSATVENPEGIILENTTLEGSECVNYGTIWNTNVGVHGIKGESAGLVNEAGARVHIGGKSAYGMWGQGASMLENRGIMEVAISGSHAILAETGSSAVNEGIVKTYGPGAAGMRVTGNSTALNTCSITTWGNLSFGMEAYSNESTSENGGEITTHGRGADGIRAHYQSLALNSDSGTIQALGDNSAGLSALFGSNAENFGTVLTGGKDSPALKAAFASEVLNSGSVETSGKRSKGISASQGSSALSSGTIRTVSEEAHGMDVRQNSQGLNKGEITSLGESAHGLFAWGNSVVTNNADAIIETYGPIAHGLFATKTSTAENYGYICTYGDGSSGMVLSDGSTGHNSGILKTAGANSYGMLVTTLSAGGNSGEITTAGPGGDAVRVDKGDFTNSGLLASSGGNAVTAKNNSTVVLLDGTVLPYSRTIEGDASSRLVMDMKSDLEAEVKGFGSLTKSGTGALTLEGTSTAGDVVHNQGGLAIGSKGHLAADNYTQSGEASLYIKAAGSVADPVSIPLSVEGTATFDGQLLIDVSELSAPGPFSFIRAGETRGDFSKVSYLNENQHGIYDFYEPQWLEGGSRHLTGMAGYSFSEQALALVAAIDGWAFWRRNIENHLRDVIAGPMEPKEDRTSFHARFLTNDSRRDPKGQSPAGFEADTRGLGFGFDKKIDDRTIRGLFAGYTEQDIRFPNLRETAADREDQKTWHLGGYYGKRMGSWFLSSTLTGHFTSHESFRRQAGENAAGDFSSWAVTGGFRASRVPKKRNMDKGWTLVPEAGFNYGYLYRSGYSEPGGFTYGDFHTTVFEVVTGVRLSGEFNLETGTRVVPRLGFAWVHNLSGSKVIMDRSWHGDTRWYTEELEEDCFDVDLTLSCYNPNGFNIFVSYYGRYGDVTDSHGGRLELEWVL